MTALSATCEPKSFAFQFDLRPSRLAISRMKFAMSRLLIALVWNIVGCSRKDQAELDEWIQGLEDILDSPLPGSEDRIQGR